MVFQDERSGLASKRENLVFTIFSIKDSLYKGGGGMRGSFDMIHNINCAYSISLISLPKPSIRQVVSNLGCRVVFLKFLSTK